MERGVDVSLEYALAATAARIKLRVLTGKNGFGVYGFTPKRLTKRSVSST
jgi:hypothetical protein